MTTPSPQDRLAALAADLYASHPRITTGPHPRRGVGYKFDARDLARALADFFGSGIRVAYLTDSDRRTILLRDKHDQTKARKLTRTEFESLVSQALRLMPSPPDSASHNVRAAARDLRELVEQGKSAYYASQVAEALLGELKALPMWDPMPSLGDADGATPPPAPVDPEHRERHRERAREWRADGYRAELGDKAPQAVDWLITWKENAEPGAHPATAVHGAYVAETPPRDAMGRNYFHRVAEHHQVLGKRRRLASGHVYVIGQEPTPMTREDRAKLTDLVLAELVEKYGREFERGISERHAEKFAEPAAESHAANVADMDAFRRRRAA